MRINSRILMQGASIPYLPARGRPGETHGPYTLTCTALGNPGDAIRAYLPVPASVMRVEARVPAGVWADISAGSGLPVVGAAGAVFTFEVRFVFVSRVDGANYGAGGRLRLVSSAASGA